MRRRCTNATLTSTREPERMPLVKRRRTIQLDHSRRRLISPKQCLCRWDDKGGIKRQRVIPRPIHPSAKWIVLRNSIQQHQRPRSSRRTGVAQTHTGGSRISKNRRLSPIKRKCRLRDQHFIDAARRRFEDFVTRPIGHHTRTHPPIGKDHRSRQQIHITRKGRCSKQQPKSQTASALMLSKHCRAFRQRQAHSDGAPFHLSAKTARPRIR